MVNTPFYFKLAYLRFPATTIFLFWLIPTLLFAEESVPLIEAVTQPSADIELSFVQAGKVASIKVEEGDTVTAGGLLAQQDNEIERIQLDIITAKANNLTPIQLAKNEKEEKDQYLLKLIAAEKNGAVTPWEVQLASFVRETALLSMKMAEFEHNQDLLQLKTIQEALHKLRLFSPINGIIEEIRIESGESVQALQTVMRVVNTTLIQIDVPVPLELARQLAISQPVIITYSDNESVEGTIDNISRVADAAANTLNVKVLADNNAERPAGERVTIQFPGITEQPQPATTE